MNLPVFEFIANQRVKLIEDYYLTNYHYIPKGFESDLGSVPSFLYWFLKPTDIKLASIIHDYHWYLADKKQYSYYVSNLEFYLNAIYFDGIPKWKAIVCFIVLEIVRKVFKEKFQLIHPSLQSNNSSQ